MLYVNSVILLVRWLALTLLALDLMLVAYILYRRITRNRYYLRKDAAQNRFAGTVAQFLAGQLPLETAVRALPARSRAEREALQLLLLGGITETTRPPATSLLYELGYVQAWAEQAFGKARTLQLLQAIREDRPSPASAHAESGWLVKLRRLRLFAISRAVAVAHLGKLSHNFAGAFMEEALRDPSPLVARVSIAAIGRSRLPNGVALLLDQLRRAVEGETDLPVRSIKTALVRYSTRELRHFAAMLNHPLPRFRFLLVDSVREICRKAEPTYSFATDFPTELRLWFLTKAVQDSSPDVRARSAAVIAGFRNAPAVESLRTLLRDNNEFVRLHAVRACRDPYYTMLLEEIVKCIGDPRWRVREAAVRTAAEFGMAGRRQLEQFFLETRDRYASEQIAEELQRSRLGLQIVQALATAEGERQDAFAVCSKLVHLEMDGLLADMLARSESDQLRGQLLQVLGPSRRPQFLSVLRQIAAREMDPLRDRAQALLSSIQASAAAAGATV